MGKICVSKIQIWILIWICRKVSRVPSSWSFGLALLAALSTAIQAAGQTSFPNIETAALAQIDEGSQIAKYVPLHLVPDRAKSEPLLTTTRVGNVVVLSGKVVFGVTQPDESRMLQWAHRKFGDSARLQMIPPKLFAIRVRMGEEVIWQRPLAAAAGNSIPIQVSRPQISPPVVAEVLVIWDEMGPRGVISVRVDWRFLLQGLQNRTQDGSLISETDVEEVCSVAIRERWVYNNNASESRITSGVLKRMLLSSVLVSGVDTAGSPAKTSLDRQFKLNAGSSKSLDSVIQVDMAFGPVERSHTFYQTLLR
jgi:hypothetical protein